MNKTLHILTILLLLMGAGPMAFAQGGGDPDPAAETPKRPRVMILGNVYGGGELAQVIAPDAATAKAQLIQDADLATLFTNADHIYTTYVHLGDSSEVYGRIFGGGKGQEDTLGESAGRVTGQTDVALDGATVWSEIYGGGEMADVRGNTLLHFKKGKAGHNAFGGGLGKLGKRDSENKLVALNPATDNLPDNRYEPLASADIKKIPANYKFITNEDEDATNLTALKELELNTPANWMAGKITGESFVVFDGTEDSYTHYEFKTARTVNRDANGVPEKIDGLYYTETNQFNPERPEQLFSINHNIYGGGMTASQIESKTFVHINYGMVNQEMMDFKYHDAKVWSMIYNSIANAQFCVFGGGYGYYTDIFGDTNITMDVQGSGQYKYINEFTDWFAGPGKEKYGWDTNVGDPELIYAAADEATWSHGAPGRSCMDIVGGGYNGRVHGSTNVTVGGDVVLRKVYGGGYYSSVGNTNVLLKSGIFNRVYGGGMIGNVYGKATLNFGQKGSYGTIKEDNVHLMVKDAIYGGNDVSGTVGTTLPGAHTQTNPYNGVTYNVYYPVDDDDHGVRLNIYGGLVLGDVYGAGNGNHPGYGNPDYMEFGFSQHPSENYRQLAHPGTKGTNLVYKYRPRTGRVVMNIKGNDGVDFNDEPLVDKVRIWGRTFGGGNSCNVGVWDGTQDDNAEVYSEGSDSWHPGDNFLGDGTIQINIGSHVQLGNRNDSHETPNGLFMGSNGEHMITQHTDKEKARYYHQYWDSKAGKYYPGFVVYEDDAETPIKRNVGLKAFGAFINNILTKSDDVHLNIDENATDVWMSNFVGGGYRGSMQAKTAAGKFSYTLPTGVTIGHSVVGGAFNAHIIYRVYATNYGDGTYKTDSEGNYIYETVEPGQGVRSKAEAEAYDREHGLAIGTTPYDYIKKLYAEGHEGDENYKTGYLRYNFDGGIMGHESGYIATANGSRCNQVRNGAFDFTSPTKYNKDKALVYLNLRNKLDPVVTEANGGESATVHGGIVYGGCFHSGYIDGDVWVDYRCSLSPLCKGKDTRFFDKTNDDLYGNVDNLEVHNALNVFGAGYGEDTHTMGDTYLRILHNGSSDDSYDYPFVYNVFGGGNMGTVAGNTNVYYNVGEKGTVMGSLYGGGYKGTIDGNTFVELAGGLIINAYGGSREANIGGATHVWAYDGANRPDGEDEPDASREEAPLLIGNLYGGNDISGTIGTADNGMEAKWTKNTWTDLEGKLFNSYVQVGGTETTRNGYPLVGNVFAGGNGEKTTSGAAPDIAKTLLEIDGGTTLRAFGGGNKATVTKDAYIFVNAPRDVFTNYKFTDVQKKVLMKTVFKGVLNGYRWEESTLKMDPYHVVKMYGGNNVATMNIQPTWGLKDGLIENVYSGGNMGDMTYYNEHGTAATTNGELATKTIGVENNADGTNANYTPRGLCITIDSPDINIKNLFGGCRLSNVVPGGYDNEGNLAQNAAFASCENLYGATINILDGKIENVFGGNDVGGKVYFGTNINISGGILGNVYGSGNGDYLYRFDKNATTVTEQIDEKLGFYYDVPEKMGETLIETAGTVGSDTHKILTINRIRPAVDNTFINIGGMEHNDGPSGSGPKRVAAVKGNIFMGGNATTITRDGNFTFGKFKLGSYTTINGLFLGSDGHSYTDNDFIEQFAELNDIEDMSAETNFESGHELDKQHNPILLNAYLMAVDVQSPPKDFTVKTPLTEAYIGTFCGGGNRGSMLHDKTVEMDFPADLVIFDKIVAGCMNATVNYNQNGTNVQSLGGYTRPLDNDDPNDNTKIRYTINSQFKPLVMDAEFDKVTGKNKHNETLAAAMGKGFVYDNLNTSGNAWMNGCNIYGGCYESGVMVGDVELNVTSSLLGHMANDGMDIFKGSVKDGMDDGVTNKSARTKFDNALANGQVIGNIYGAGFGQESDVQGNVRINIYAPGVSSPGNPVHPSANNVYGGGRSGQLHGNSYIRLTDGHVYNDVVGGCDAATMYGSTYIGIGYPTYYKCNATGAYSLTRGDRWNSSKIKQTVYYKAGDFIAPNVWSQMSTADLDKFAPQNEMVGTTNDIWNKTDIIVRGGVYGGGFTVASSTTGMAGSYTVLRELDGSGNKTNYGGNSTIVVTDRGSFGDDDHIRISTRISSDTGDGGIYGDGHLTFCEGFRAADLTGYGYNTASPSAPRLLNTFQRLDLLDVNDCCLELQGAQDFAANQIDATTYSLTRIDELRMNSSLTADAAVTPLSNPNGTAADGFSSSKVRNYIGFNNLVHYLGALVTNDKFDDSQHTFRGADGTMGARSYQAEKAAYIEAYTNAGSKTQEVVNAFKKRNQGTARNCIGLNNGLCLRIQNLGDGNKLYYGPIVGVAEVKLLSLQQGEGGGYVYADNIHADGNNFLNTSGNFVFPGAVGQGVDSHGDPIADQYIVDDCFMDKFGTPDALTTKHGNLDEAHYWYVEGNKYFYNTTLTGYTFQDAIDFNLTDNDPNVILSGMEKGSRLDIKKIDWQSTHRGGYACVLENDQTSPEMTDDYQFDIEVGGASYWTNHMPRYDAGADDPYYTTGKKIGNTEGTYLPQFNIKLQDKLDNSGDAKYTNHLDEPEKVKIYLEGETNGQKYEYTVTLNIIYLQGPTYEGGVEILNCALPGERIGFSSGGIKIKTPDLMPVTATAWEILPFDKIEGGIWKWDSDHGVDIPTTQYSEDLTGNLSGWIPALYKQNEYNIAYIFTAGGHKFPVMPKQNATLKQNRMIVVHNYHRMKEIVAQGIEESVTAGACVYLQDEDDLTKFVEWVNAGKLTEGVNFILQDSIRLTKPLTALSQSFAGTFHGDGYHINLGTHAGSLFGSQLTGQVYNLGIIGGTIATTGTRTNCYEGTALSLQETEYKYGKKAYALSHYFTPTHEGASAVTDANNYVKNRYANGDYQYATSDRVWSLRTGEPWYGHTETRHDCEHAHDADRWQPGAGDGSNPDVLMHKGKNIPLYDGTREIANKNIHDAITDAVIGTKLGLPENYANDYLFFGQHLDKTNGDPYPVHINPTAKGDTDYAKGGNRVYKTSGFYQSATDQGFYYNRDVWALQPTLTAIDFTYVHPNILNDHFGYTLEGDGTHTTPASFNVDSNADYGDSYDNKSYGHVSQNLLVYREHNSTYETDILESKQSGYTGTSEEYEAIYAEGNYADNTPEEDIRYHLLINRINEGNSFDQSRTDVFDIDYFHLVDCQDYHAPQDFFVDSRAWYERLPQAYRNAAPYETGSAWEGLCLPFAFVTRVYGEEDGNELSHFYGVPTSEMLNNPATNIYTLHHEYWLAGLAAADDSGVNFARPSTSGDGLFTDSKQYTWTSYTLNNTYYNSRPNYSSPNEGHYGTRDDANWYASPHTFTSYPHITMATPYLVAFPGEDFYEFDLTDQKVTFEFISPRFGGTIRYPIPATGSSEIDNYTAFLGHPDLTTTVNGYSHVGTYTHVTAGASHLGINAAGTAFDVQTTGHILPFRTYMTTTASSSPHRIVICDGGQGAIDVPLDEDINIGDLSEPTLLIYGQGTAIVVESNYDTELRIYTPAGRFVQTLHVTSGRNIYEGFHPDIYIVGGKKLRLTTE